MRIVSLALLTFLAVTAAAGGLGLLTGILSPPVGMLAGSPFTTYLVPGLVLLVCVGGLAATAAILVVMRHRLAWAASMMAAGMILAFEIVEIAIIGSPAGVARVLQALYIGVGIAIIVAARRRLAP
jgi:hypothetical protein